MNNEELINKLMGILKNRKPILLLGAGFSYGAYNGDGQELLLGKDLSEKLFNDIVSKSLIDPSDLDQAKSDKHDLKLVCNYIEALDLEDKRNEFLTNIMSGCYCTEGSYHMKLKTYPWKYIFTLNIDDLVEYIYKDSNLSIQIFSNHYTGENNLPELIKLHGSVTEPEKGYIFSDSEYLSYMSSERWSTTIFGVEFMRNDVIILGTEFQENDLALVIEKMKNITDSQQDVSYFFVTPNIKSFVLNMKIKSANNMHHICMTTEEFLNILEEKVARVDNERQILREKGMIFLHEEKSRQSQNLYQVADLYSGSPPQLKDFFQNFDIQYPKVPEIDSENSHLICIYGESYVGKTCIAKRHIVDYMNQGFEAVEFPLTYDMNSLSYKRSVMDYLHLLPKNSKVAILSESSSLLYDIFLSILSNLPDNIDTLVIISTASLQDYRSSSYLFDDVNYVKHLHVKETISNHYAENIYEKLSYTNHLNELRKYGSNEKEITYYIKSLNDIIEVLYVSSNGRGFSEHYNDWLLSQNDDIYRKAFIVLSFFSSININNLLIPNFNSTMQGIEKNFDFSEFIERYKEVLRIENSIIKVRCARLLKNVLDSNLNDTTIIDVIVSFTRILSPNIKDQERSYKSDLFQKSIKVKNLIRSNMKLEHIMMLLEKIKSRSKHLSYFWIQYGIIYRHLGYFEEANNSFGEAVAVRGKKSYHISHAEAKNYMEWGLWEIDHNLTRANHYFTIGKNTISSLIIENSTRYLQYSVNTYADMTLKFYRKLNLPIPTEDAKSILAYLLIILRRNNKTNYFDTVIKNFLSECEENKIDIDITQLKKIYTPSYIKDTQQLDIDEIDTTE